MTKRLIFGLSFFLGSLVAAAGWILPMLGMPYDVLAIIGHSMQIIAIIGIILVPDEIEMQNDEAETIV